MTDILQAILEASDSFCESDFYDIEERGLTRAWIMQFIGIDPQSCESNQQLEVIVAIFYHLVDELYAKGCTKSEICALARLTAQYWQESIDRSLQENVRQLQAAIEPLLPRPVSERSAELYLKYMVHSFLQHFALYRACLAQAQTARQRQGPKLRRSVCVESPDAPAPLREGRRPEEHRYFCLLKEIDTEEQLARAGRTNRRLGDNAELMQRRREVEDRVEASEIDEEYPKSLISECIEVNIRQMRLNVQDMAENSSIDLIHKAKRTALPRPISMGPPPRFVAAAGGGAEKKSAASSRSSAKSRTGEGKKSRAK